MQITLKAARVNAGLTQAKAAELLGISPCTLLTWERKPENVSALWQKKIAEVFGVSINDIIFLPTTRE